MEALIGGLALVLVAIIEAFAARDRKQAKTERERTLRRAERREKESILSMKMMDANCALSIIVAKKMAGHKTNGDVEEAMKTASDARQEYETFLRELAAHEVNKL